MERILLKTESSLETKKFSTLSFCSEYREKLNSVHSLPTKGINL